MARNLPDDVTPGMIDEHYEPPDTILVHGTVYVGASATVSESSSPAERVQALMDAVRQEMTQGAVDILDAEVEEVDP